MPKISAKFDRGHPLRGRRMQVGGDFKFGTLTSVASPTLPIKNIPWKGRGQSQANRFRILHPV